MKVNMKIESKQRKTGWFSAQQFHVLDCHVEYTPEEKAAIKCAGLEKFQIVTRPMTTKSAIEFALDMHPKLNGWSPINVSAFLDKTHLELDYFNAIDAQRSMQDLKDNLVYLKSAIEQTSAPASESFEL